MRKSVKEALRETLKQRPEGYNAKDLRKAKKNLRNGLLRLSPATAKKSCRQERLSAKNPGRRSGFPVDTVIKFPPAGRRYRSGAHFKVIPIVKS